MTTMVAFGCDMMDTSYYMIRFIGPQRLCDKPMFACIVHPFRMFSVDRRHPCHCSQGFVNMIFPNNS